MKKSVEMGREVFAKEITVLNSVKDQIGDVFDQMLSELMNCQGKFLVSYNDCPEIRQLWTHPNIQIESIQRTNNLAQRYEAGSQYDELLISNYDTAERAREENADFKQLSLLE